MSDDKMDMVPRSRVIAMDLEIEEARAKLAKVQKDAGDEIQRLQCRLDQSEHERALDAKLLDNVRGHWEHRVKELESRLHSAVEALRSARKELETTTWECERCGESSPMTSIDLHDQLVHNLAAFGDPCDGNHMAPECAAPQCWRRVVEIPEPIADEKVKLYRGGWEAVDSKSRQFRVAMQETGEPPVETPFPPDHQPLDTQGDCPCAVCRPSRDVEIPEHFVTCPHCKTRFSGVGDYMSDFNRHIQECSGKKVERRCSIHPADCILSCKGCGAAPGEAHAVGCEFE
jgi:hypothetical protein